MKEVIFKLPDEVLTLIIHKVENTPQEASLLEKWIYDGEERNTGEWYLDKSLCTRCSNCNRISTNITANKPPFCQWCGAKMEEVK